MMFDAISAELVKKGWTSVGADLKAGEIIDTLNMIGYRPITKEGYEELRRDSNFLGLLEQYGVDNWEGYYEVIQAMGDQ